MAEPAGASERPYHHGHLRDALLTAALGLTRRGGSEALGLREVTRQVGVSPNAAYRHFADRRALLAAVATEIQQTMWQRMIELAPESGQGAAESNQSGPPGNPVSGEGSEQIRHARSTLRAVGLGYIEFALAEPGWFEVAFGDIPPLTTTSVGSATQHDRAGSAAPFQMLVDALDDLVRGGALSAERRVGAEWPCWSTVHGFAMLALQGPLRDQPADQLRRAAERSVDMIIDGLLDAGDDHRVAGNPSR